MVVALDFVAVDVETANEDRGSTCSLGWAIVSTSSSEEQHRQQVFATMEETEKLQVKVDAAPAGSAEEVPIDFFTVLLNRRTI